MNLPLKQNILTPFGTVQQTKSNEFTSHTKHSYCFLRNRYFFLGGYCYCHEFFKSWIFSAVAVGMFKNIFLLRNPARTGVSRKEGVQPGEGELPHQGHQEAEVHLEGVEGGGHRVRVPTQGDIFR